MNWIGGRLQRHQRNSGNTALNRQRQHFARVRQRLQNGDLSPEKMHFRPNLLLRDASDLSEVSPFDQGLHMLSGCHQKTQTKLEDFSSTAPLARRLATMKKRCFTSQPVDGSKSPAAEDRLESKQASSHGTIKLMSSSMKRQANSHESTSTSGDSRCKVLRPTQVDTIEAQKKIILAQRDWVGLTSSRPLHMRFPSHQEKEQIGKRRKINRGSQAKGVQYCEEKAHRDKGDGMVAGREDFMSARLRDIDESISVRIGDDALSSQLSVVQEPISRVEPVPSLPRGSSDTMLFDVEQAGESEYLGVEAHDLSLSRPNGQKDPEVCLKSDLDTACVSAFATNPFFLASTADTQLTHAETYPTRPTNDGPHQGETVDDEDRDEDHHLLNEIHATYPSYSHDSKSVGANSHFAPLDYQHQHGGVRRHVGYHSVPSDVAYHHSTSRSASDFDEVPAHVPSTVPSNFPRHAKLLSSPSRRLAVDLSPLASHNQDRQAENRWSSFLPTSTADSDTETSASFDKEISGQDATRSSELTSMARQGGTSIQRSIECMSGKGSGVPVMRSTPPSLRNTSIWAKNGAAQTTLSQEEGRLQDALWKRFVFGSDEESTPSDNSHEEIAQSSASMRNNPATSDAPQAAGTANRARVSAMDIRFH